MTFELCLKSTRVPVIYDSHVLNETPSCQLVPTQKENACCSDTSTCMDSMLKEQLQEVIRRKGLHVYAWTTTSKHGGRARSVGPRHQVSCEKKAKLRCHLRDTTPLCVDGRACLEGSGHFYTVLHDPATSVDVQLEHIHDPLVLLGPLHELSKGNLACNRRKNIYILVGNDSRSFSG